MDTSSPSKFSYLLCLFLLLSSTLIFCSSGSFLSTPNHFLHKQFNKPLLVQTAQHDTIVETPPITTLPTNPVTTPATGTGTGTAPPDFSMSPIVTIPSVNPVAPITFPPATPNPLVTPPIPITNPVTTPSTTTPLDNPTAPITFPPATQNPLTPTIPITNPVTTPSTTIPGGPQPVTTYPFPTTTPVVAPPGPTTTNAPVTGQNWCIAKSGVQAMDIQVGLDYACGLGGADCSTIQDGGSCYNPNSLQNHASYAFNSYYQRNPVQTSCDFGGTAMITRVNPSTGSCVFTTRSSSSIPPPTTTTSSPPVTTTPITMPTPTPTTESSSGATPSGSVTSPTVFNASGPALGSGIIPGYGGESPPTANISSASSRFQPFLGCIIVVTTIITGGTVLDHV